MSGYSRKGRIIHNKFYHFLLPTILSYVAASLNEFVDSILVSQLLGSDAMTLVGMASPMMLLFAVLFGLLGIGGAVVYAELAGKQEQERADRAFSLVFFVSVAVALITAGVGIAFLNPISEMMCKETALLPSFIPYMRVLILSGILIIPLQVLICFFPAFGKPHVGSTINIVANGVNLVMDYVFIRFFNTGVKGAAMATFTGYIVGALIVVVLLIGKKVSMPLRKILLSDFHALKESIGRGAASAANQLGNCIKVAFCNGIAMSLAGLNGVTIFTLCIQSISIVSIALGGIIGAMSPLAAAMRGQRDYNGIRLLMRKVMVVQTIANAAFFLLFEFYPQLFLHLFNYTGSDTESAITGIRIFAVMFLFRGFTVIFMYYFPVISRKVYALVISLIDGFAGLIPLTLILTAALGITGLWLAFPVLSALLLIGILVVNAIILKRSHGKYRGVFLLENEDPGVSVYDATVPLEKGETENVVGALQEFCRDHMASDSLPMMVSLAFEEMLAFTSSHKGKEISFEEVDVLMKIRPETVIMDVRSVGAPLDPASAPREAYSNIDVLMKVASSVEYNYVLGMNQTRIKINPNSF